MSILIQADFTCDNSFQVWLGDSNQVVTKVKEESYTTASDLMAGEHFSFSANPTDYLYLIAWSDDDDVQGLIGSFYGDVQIDTGHPDWKVLPTQNNKNGANFPTISEVNTSISSAIPSDWKIPFLGPTNANTNQLFHNTSNPIPNVPLQANWVWYDSGRDSSSPSGYNAAPPFKGFNHDEFLIFRLPIQSLATCCSPCEEDKAKGEVVLKKKAMEKEFVISGSENNIRRCADPYSDNSCSAIRFPKIEPCFYLHWGDSPADQMETHDDEVMYLTVCNPYRNLTFHGLTISKITITPAATTLPNGEDDIDIIPDRFICFDKLGGCSCSSRELTLLTRGAAPQSYKLVVEYCIDNIAVNDYRTGETSFEIELINS